MKFRFFLRFAAVFSAFGAAALGAKYQKLKEQKLSLPHGFTVTAHTGCNGSRASISSKTGKDISGVELPFKAKQLVIGDKKFIKTQTTSAESTKYNDWFKAVYVKGAQPAAG